MMFIDVEKAYNNVIRGFYGDVWRLKVYLRLILGQVRTCMIVPRHESGQ